MKFNLVRETSIRIVALKSMYPLLSLLCTKISSCGCAER